MVRSQTQEPQRASGDNATVGRLFVLEASGDRMLSLNPDGSDRKVIVTECRSPTASRSTPRRDTFIGPTWAFPT